MKISRVVSGLWGRASPSPIDLAMAYKTACTTVQVVIQYGVKVVLLSANFILTRIRWCEDDPRSGDYFTSLT